MDPKEVTKEEIGQLPHLAKIAFAARCARIVWNELRKLRPDATGATDTLIEDALRLAEQSGEAPAILPEKKQPLSDALQRLKQYANAYTKIPSPEQEVASAICLALEAGLSENEIAKEDKATGIKTPKDEKTADLTYQAFRQARDAAREITSKFPRTAPTLKERFLERARYSIDHLLKDLTVMNSGGGRPPEYFTETP